MTSWHTFGIAFGIVRSARIARAAKSSRVAREARVAHAVRAARVARGDDGIGSVAVGLKPNYQREAHNWVPESAKPFGFLVFCSKRVPERGPNGVKMEPNSVPDLTKMKNLDQN